MLTLEYLVLAFVQVMTCDGRFIVGILEGYDQLTNIVIRDARERCFSSTEGFKEINLGIIYGIRGDNV